MILHGEEYTQRRVTHLEELRIERSYVWRGVTYGEELRTERT